RFFKLPNTFCVVSLAWTPSIEICISCSPASLSASINSGRKKKPLEIIPVRKKPSLRHFRIRSGSSGCSVGSPPVKEIPKVPRLFNFRSRSSRTSVGTGSLTLSYSEQKLQDRLQQR